MSQRNSNSSDVIDIHSTGEGVASQLSNFTRHSFTFRGVRCESIEGVLQATKSDDIATQHARCLLSGVQAKRAGKKGRDWKKDQVLFWGKVAMRRVSTEYEQFIDELYDAVFKQCPEFRSALAQTENCTLTHSIARGKQRFETVLTEDEFIKRLNSLRTRLNAGQ